MRRAELMARIRASDGLQRLAGFRVEGCGNGLNDAMEEVPNLGPELVGITGTVIGEFRHLGWARETALVLGLVKRDEGHQQADGAAHGFTLRDLVRARRVGRCAGCHGRFLVSKGASV